MASLLSSIGTMASTFINSISIIADSCSLVFTIFPIEIKALLVWGVGFLVVISVVKFAKGWL